MVVQTRTNGSRKVPERRDDRYVENTAVAEFAERERLRFGTERAGFPGARRPLPSSSPSPLHRPIGLQDTGLSRRSTTFSLTPFCRTFCARRLTTASKVIRADNGPLDAVPWTPLAYGNIR